tara:strand:+ start:3399 stop:4184 length:786 start_codon:yes stop_codon:yes gene_type:complete
MTSSQVQANETPPMSAQDIESLKDENGLIAGKFKTVEDMANSYKELEGKLGDIERTKEEPEATDEEPKAEESDFNAEELYGEGLASVLEEVGIDAEDITQRFTESGNINEDDYSKLNEAGFSKQVVDTYLDGLRGASANTEDISTAAATEIKNSVGGEEAYNELVQWSSNNLPEETIKSFDELLNTASVPVIKIAVAGLKAQMNQAQGYEPDLIGGRSPRSNNNPFQTPAEVTAAMNDPRYGKDAAYTQSVYARLENSDVV